MAEDDDFLVPGGALGGRLFQRALQRLPSSAPVQAGDRFGPFRVISELGSGGMGQVFLAARDDPSVQQQVALKLVRPGVDHAAMQALFRRERQMLVELDHPNIARFIDAGETDDGRLWCAMAWIEGQTLAARLQAGPCQESDVFRWMQALCQAVAYAHQRLIVHGDLKPANIMLTQAGDLKLLDFGIARLHDEAEAPRAHSPRWASPEQLTGARLGPASDVFQLGLILEFLWVQCVDAHPRRGLAAIIAKAKAIEPNHRYRSAGELAEDLLAAQQWRSLRAGDHHFLQRIERLLRRQPWASAAWTTAVMILLLVISMFTLRLERERDLARTEAQRATAATQFLAELFRVADPGITRGDTLTANQILSRGSERLQSELQDQPEVRAQLMSTVASVHMGLGQTQQAAAIIAEADAIARSSKLAAEDIAGIQRVHAQILWRLGRFSEALPISESALARLQGRPVTALHVQLLHTATVCLLMLGRLDESLDKQSEALRLAKQYLPKDDPLVSMGLNNLARIHAARGQPELALQAMAEARQNLINRLGADHPDTLDLGVSYAKELGNNGRTEAGLAILRDIEPTLRRVVGEAQFRYGYLLLVRSHLQLHAGRASEAATDAERAVANLAQSTGPQTLFSANAEHVQAEVLLALGDAEQALVHANRAQAIRDAALPANHVDRIESMIVAGIAQCQQGQTEASQLTIAAASSAQLPWTAHTSALLSQAKQCLSSSAALNN